MNNFCINCEKACYRNSDRAWCEDKGKKIGNWLSVFCNHQYDYTPKDHSCINFKERGSKIETHSREWHKIHDQKPKLDIEKLGINHAYSNDTLFR